MSQNEKLITTAHGIYASRQDANNSIKKHNIKTKKDIVIRHNNCSILSIAAALVFNKYEYENDELFELGHDRTLSLFFEFVLI